MHALTSYMLINSCMKSKIDVVRAFSSMLSFHKHVYGLCMCVANDVHLNVKQFRKSFDNETSNHLRNTKGKPRKWSTQKSISNNLALKFPVFDINKSTKKNRNAQISPFETTHYEWMENLSNRN